jgi:hypothetical protein
MKDIEYQEPNEYDDYQELLLPSDDDEETEELDFDHD